MRALWHPISKYTHRARISSLRKEGRKEGWIDTITIAVYIASSSWFFCHTIYVIQLLLLVQRSELNKYDCTRI